MFDLDKEPFLKKEMIWLNMLEIIHESLEETIKYSKNELVTKEDVSDTLAKLSVALRNMIIENSKIIENYIIESE